MFKSLVQMMRDCPDSFLGGVKITIIQLLKDKMTADNKWQRCESAYRQEGACGESISGVSQNMEVPEWLHSPMQFGKT